MQRRGKKSPLEVVTIAVSIFASLFVGIWLLGKLAESIYAWYQYFFGQKDKDE